MRANWGGGGNLSGIFENLFDEWRARAEAATARNVRRAKEEQAALDAETYDKWKNGLLTDEQWLEYIKGRVEDSKHDPQEHAEWKNTLREHTTAIVDAQTETAFENGEISVHAIIGYYRDRLEKVERNSPEYRELIGRYWQLIDTRDSDQIYADAERIIDRIERGQGSYGDLLNYYKTKLKNVRKNSDLYRQITREIDSIQDIVDGVTGGRGGGGGGGGGGRRSGGGVTAQEVTEINDALLLRARGGSVYDSSGNDPIPSITQLATEDLDQYKTALMADINRLNTLMEQEKNNPEADWLTDPLTGEALPNSPEMLRELDNMFLRAEEMLFAINWSEGEWDDAMKALEYRQEYITNHMQRHNSETVRDAWDEQVRGAFAGIAAASANPDPSARVRAYAELSRTMQRHADALLNDVSEVETRGVTEGADDTRASRTATQRISRTLETMPDDILQQDVAYTVQLFQAFSDPNMDLATRQSVLEALVENRPDGYWLTDADLDAYINSSLDGTGPPIGVMETHAAREGLAMVGPDGRSAFVLMDTGGITRAVPREVLAETQRDQQMVMTLERVAGGVQYVWRPVLPAGDQDTFDIWVDKDGRPIPERELTAYTLSDFINLEASGQISRRVVHEGWSRIVMSDGRTWFQDPQTRLWYADEIPVRVQRDQTGAVLVNENGEPQYEMLPWASEAGVVAPFVGLNPRDAQRAIEQAIDLGDIDLADYFTRDEAGNAVFSHPDTEGMYWDPADDLIMKNMSETRYHRRFVDEKNQKMAEFKTRQEKRRRAAADAWLESNFDAEQQRMWRKLNPETNLRDVARDAVGPFGGLMPEGGASLADPKIRFGLGDPKPVDKPKLTPIRRDRTVEKMEMELPKPPLPATATGRAVAPVLPAPPRPNLPEFPDTTPPPKPPPIKSSAPIRRNFRER